MLVVDQRFHDLASGDVVPIDKGVRISFDKQFSDTVSFGQFDVSTFDGGDVFAPSDDNPIQQWDKYKYEIYSDRVVSMEYSRQVDFPYSVQSAIGDITLDNHDGYFTPNGNSPIANYLLPKRPIRLFAGYQTEQLVQQLVGMTQGSPEVDNDTRTVSFTVMDFLSEIFDLPLTNTIAMRDAYTGEIIEQILQQFGILPAQYNIARGRNRVPFVFFERGLVKAGEVLRQLMQAEQGNLWLSEAGIIRFEPRILQDEAPVMTFDGSNIISISDTADGEIVNSVAIHTELREVQAFQSIFSRSSASSSSVDTTFVIPTNSTKTIEVNLQDPTYSYVEPTQGHATNVSWFTASQADGSPAPAGVSVIDSELKTNSISLEFYNANNFSIYIDNMEIWGEPAKKYDEITFPASDPASIDKYGIHSLEIDNNYFGSIENCRSFAQTIIHDYADYATKIRMTVKGDFSLQLGDVVAVNYDVYNANYKITSLSYKLPEETIIEARYYVDRNYGFFNVNNFNDGSVFAP